MSTIRTIRQLTRVARELEQLSKAMEGLGAAAQATAPMFAQLAQAARPVAVKGRIERVDKA